LRTQPRIERAYAQRLPIKRLEAALQRLVLQPLGHADAVAIVEALLGSSGVPPDVSARIVEASEGNPLFVEQYLSMLVDTGVLRPTEGGWIRADEGGDLSVPPGITALLTARLDTLSGEARATIEPASVIGQQFARAALESIAFQSAEVLLAMQRDARQPLVELRVDGGATANDLMMQFQADLLGVPVVRPKVTETTALGAAYLAGLAVGFWSSLDEVAANWQVDRRFEPRMGRELAAARLRQWQRAVERSRDWHVED